MIVTQPMKYYLPFFLGGLLGAIALLVFFVFWAQVPAAEVGAKVSLGFLLYAFLIIVFGWLVSIVHKATEALAKEPDDV